MSGGCSPSCGGGRGTSIMHEDSHAQTHISKHTRTHTQRRPGRTAGPLNGDAAINHVTSLPLTYQPPHRIQSADTARSIVRGSGVCVRSYCCHCGDQLLRPVSEDILGTGDILREN